MFPETVNNMQVFEASFLGAFLVLFIAFITFKFFKPSSCLTETRQKRLKETFYEEEIEKKRKNAGRRVRHIAAGGSIQQNMQNNHKTSSSSDVNTPTPESVNYHFTRQCNYKCGFCFHTAKTSFVLPMEEAKRGLKLLKAAGMKKINFSGGEPFIHERGRYVGELTKFCKKDLQMPSVSIVSNGSLIKEKWFHNYGEFLDILAISCDSFNEETNQRIGRHKKGTSHIECLMRVREWCKIYCVAFKINTVVNSYNLEDNMIEQIRSLAPVRWKVFQCLLIAGENCGEDAIKNAESFVISDDDFQRFIERHSELPCLVEESNKKMRSSYLILDEYMRFLDCSSGSKKPSRSILDVGVENAIQSSGFDEEMFFKRGGKYNWSKEDMKLDW